MTATNRPLIPLESGDRRTRAEFHRRYCARPDIYKAELVDGVVYVATRVRADHGAATAALCAWAGTYAAYEPDVHVAVRVTTLLGTNSEVQPDVAVFRDVAADGRARATPEDYLEGPPELIAEVAMSSASYDLHDKLEVYRRAGVPEYIVWRILDERIDWFRLRNGRYVRAEPDGRGVIESASFPGLRLAVAKMLAGDLAGVLDELTPPGGHASGR
jgi:Uma2 family endonuclease